MQLNSEPALICSSESPAGPDCITVVHRDQEPDSRGSDTVAGNSGDDYIKDSPSEIDESFTFWVDWVDDD